MPLANKRRWLIATRVHAGLGAQMNVWLYRPDPTQFAGWPFSPKYPKDASGKTIPNGKPYDLEFWTGQGSACVGDLKWVAQLLHYGWRGSASSYEGVIEMDGYGNHPAGQMLAVFANVADGGPAEGPYVQGYQARGINVWCKGGPDAAPFNRPSFTAQASRNLWGPIVNADVLADWKDFLRVKNWITSGGYGSFPRGDIVGVDLYSLMYHIFRSSQRFLEEGAALIQSLNAWWLSSYGPVPAAPAYNDQFNFPVVINSQTKTLEVRGGKVVEVWEYTALPTGAVVSYAVLTNPGLPAGADVARNAYLPDAPGQRVRATL